MTSYAPKVTVDVESGEVRQQHLTAKEIAERQALADRSGAEEAARREAEQAKALQRAQAAAVSLNNPVVRTSKEQRDAFAILIGVQPLTIPLTQDATAADIRPLGEAPA